jgi:hypothetical protein
VTNPAVYNLAPPARRLSDQQKSLLVAYLAANLGTFRVGAILSNGEAYRYAQDWSEVLTAAGWHNEEPIPVGTFMITGEMWSGLRISVPGNWDDASKSASFLNGSPEKNALDCLRNLNISGVAIPYKDMTIGNIGVDVSEHP